MHLFTGKAYGTNGKQMMTIKFKLYIKYTANILARLGLF